MLEDIRYAIRQFLKTPGFTLTAILTLALGIGATTAIFTLIHAILLKSLPVARPSELIRVGDTENCCINGGMQNDWSLFSTDQYRRFRDQTPGLSDLAAFEAGRDAIGVRRAGSNHGAEPYMGEFVSGNAFDTLGVSAWMGRLLRPADDVKGAPLVVVMSYRTWQQKFGQDASVVGSSVFINGQAFTVVGITPPGFFGERLMGDPASFYLPLSASPVVANGAFDVLDNPQLTWLNLIGRLQPGVDTKKMETQLQLELHQSLLDPAAKVDARDAGLIPKQTLHLSPGGGGVQQLQNDVKDGLHLLMWISTFVLLIACANIANLMLVRATTRKAQTSVRSALGAPRSRLVRQALTESLVLAVLGGAAGLAVAYGGARLLLHLASGRSYLPINASPSLPVLGFAFAAALVTGVLFGTAPAWMTAHTDPIEALRGSNRSTRKSGLWAQRSLVVIQAAVSLALLCAAGLLIRSMSNLQNRHFGFETRNRYMIHIDPQMAGYKAAQAEAFFRQLHDSLAAIPGVKGVAWSTYSPMDGNNWGEDIWIEGQAPPAPGSGVNNASWVRVSPDFFDTIGTRVIAGRGIREQDTVSTQNIAVVNETFAKRFFKDGNAIGQHFGDEDPKYAGNFEIVGITEDTIYRNPSQKVHPMFFLPAAQWAKYDDPSETMFENVSHLEMGAIEIETRGYVPGLEAEVRRVISGINPNLAILDYRTFAAQVQDQFNSREVLVQLTTVFGFLALTLAAIGLYGVTAYSVAQRTSEIGIRMALGADRGGILQMVLRGAFLEAGIGLVIGMPAAILGGRYMASMLYNVKTWDPPVLIATTLILAVAAFLAAVIPAQRAASVEPMTALRVE